MLPYVRKKMQTIVSIETIFSSHVRAVLVIFFLVFVFGGCSKHEEKTASAPHVLTGLDQIAQGKIQTLKGLRLGVITNLTGVTRDRKHIIDVFEDNPDVNLSVLFAPEHGIRGQKEGGDRIDMGVDEKTGIPIYSLYGENRKPTKEMLSELDALVFDIQDVGCRFYTYISTMSLAMEAAAENSVRFIVLDRPNPIGGTIVEGPVLDPQFKSFVGIQPIALRHGMTVGELAQMFNGEGWLADSAKVDLQIVPMLGWKREMVFDDTGLPWVAPSPNIPSPTTALVYPGMGLLEATNFSEGRGTNDPFLLVGSPWLNGKIMIEQLRAAHIAGLEFAATDFVPVDIPGRATNPKYKDQTCSGIAIQVNNAHAIKSVKFGLDLLVALHKLYPKEFGLQRDRLARMIGVDWVYDEIMQRMPADSIEASWQDDLQKFMATRAKYLLYQ